MLICRSGSSRRGSQVRTSAAGDIDPGIGQMAGAAHRILHGSLELQCRAHRHIVDRHLLRAAEHQVGVEAGRAGSCRRRACRGPPQCRTRPRGRPGRARKAATIAASRRRRRRRRSRRAPTRSLAQLGARADPDRAAALEQNDGWRARIRSDRQNSDGCAPGRDTPAPELQRRRLVVVVWLIADTLLAGYR